MSEIEQKCIPITVSEMNNAYLKVAAKFRAYRLEAESTDEKLKEAEAVIDRLKNELNCARDAEKNLRSQIIAGASRLIYLQEMLKKFFIVSEQQRHNEKVSQNIEQKIEEFREKIDQTRQETRNFIESVSSNLELMKKNKNLETALAVIEKKNDLMKTEIQTLIQEKKIMETEFQKKLKTLENDLEKAVKKECETETRYCDMLQYYKEQIKNYEQKVECYEKERKSLLEDFEPPISNCNNIAWMESNTTSKTNDRSPKTSNFKRLSIVNEESDEGNTQVFQCTSFQGKPKRVRFKKEKAAVFSRMPKKQKPQLEFLTASQDSLRTLSPIEFGRKRRLFSTNCNHYID